MVCKINVFRICFQIKISHRSGHLSIETFTSDIRRWHFESIMMFCLTVEWMAIKGEGP